MLKRGDILEVLHQHVTVARRLEEAALCSPPVIDVLAEIVPVLAVDVGAVDIGKRF
jgi:hypothetical protein